MSKAAFLKYLAWISLSLLVLVFSLHGRGEIGKFTDFSIYSILSFSMLSYLMFKLGERAATSKNKFVFNNIIIGNMILKMVVSILIILIYKNVYSVNSRAFLLPFLIIYLVYTIFETHFLTKLAKSS